MIRYARHCVCYNESFQTSGNIMGLALHKTHTHTHTKWLLTWTMLKAGWNLGFAFRSSDNSAVNLPRKSAAIDLPSRTFAITLVDPNGRGFLGAGLNLGTFEKLARFLEKRRAIHILSCEVHVLRPTLYSSEYACAEERGWGCKNVRVADK